MWKLAGVNGSALILSRFDEQCQKIAKSLPGRFTVMEDLEGRRLLGVAEVVDRGNGPRAAGALLAFGKASHTKLPPTLTNKLESMRGGSFPAFRTGTAARALDSLRKFSEDPSGDTMLVALDAIEALGDAVCRQEAWSDMRRSAVAWAQGAESLTAAVRLTRDRARATGRSLPHRGVSRAVLVKGQEFDHCLVTDVHGMSGRELYVALSRARSSVMVLSETPMLAPTS
jgi:DNA helicase-2/ATP-dependent DNA helicase PcrA